MLKGDIDNKAIKSILVDGHILFNGDVPDYDYIKKIEEICLNYSIVIFITPEYYDSFMRNADVVNLFYDNYIISDYDSIIEYSIKSGIIIYTDGANLLKFSGRGVLLSEIRGLR